MYNNYVVSISKQGRRMIIKENLKRLLLADLCARLPYGVMILHEDMEGKKVITKLVGYNGEWFNYYIDNLCYHLKLHEFKPYLRPMSSMTEEEFVEYHHIKYNKVTYRDKWKRIDVGKYHNVGIIPVDDYIDWLNKNMFDYRGLIPMGLALEASENMYNTK